MRRLEFFVLIALLSIDTTFSGEVESANGILDAKVADVTKKSQSFVTATHGSANTLTLTTYVTDASHLHYAVLPAGQLALDAVEIKNAAAQCRDVVEDKNARFPGMNNVERVKSTSVLEANTVTVSKAQQVVSVVENLQPNTSYDVYFVAEVIGSNGVFGPVQSVLKTWTHPEPPEIEIIGVQPANGTADTVVISATLTTLGCAYFALVPSDVDALLTPEDLVKNRTSDIGSAKSQFALHSIPLGTNDSYTFHENVRDLTPATLYDLFVITEAPGRGEVRSEVIRHVKTVRTHVLAPEVTKLTCSPLNASATALDIGFKLDVDQEDLDRVKPETLSHFRYDLHYEAIALSDGATNTKQSTVTSNSATVSTEARATVSRSTDDISALKSTTMRGVFSMKNFSSVPDFHAGIREIHHANITGLQSGILYKVKLRAESAGSKGLFSLRELTAQATTHEVAPVIVSASVQATNKSVNSLTLTVDLERQRGNVHYFLTGKSWASTSLRSVFQQATSVENLRHRLRERGPKESEDSSYITGLVTFSSEERVSSSRSSISPGTNPNNGARPGTVTEDIAKEAFRQQFEITGLEDATSYSIVLLPETTNSFGLFGRAFSTLLEAATNENASEVELRSASPLYGNMTAIKLEVSMTKPKDILFLCLEPPMPSSDMTRNDNDATLSPDTCREVENRSSFELSRESPNTFTFSVGNLTEDSEYRVSLYTENAHRNGVLSKRSDELSVRTHKSAPRIIDTSTHPTAASTSQIEAHVMVEPDYPCKLHYVVREAMNPMETEARKFVDAATILEYSYENRDVRSQFQHRLPSSSSPAFVSGGNVFVETGAHDTMTNFAVKGLSTNTTYELFVVTETSRDGNSSGVLGEPVAFNVTTHAVAPKIMLATVDPVDGSTDSIIISANLSHPGMLHYFLSDVDFADPAIISHSKKHTPHELRGQLEVLEQHILMEIINGTNDTRPTEPFVFVHNTTVGGLKAGTTYHVSLTTETYGSNGVFGEFPPPVLVNTHLDPPVIIADKLSVHPVDGSSSALAIDFQLDRFGDVHYALFFRGLVPDRSHQFDPAENRPLGSTDNEGNESISVWPPPLCTFELANLNGSMLKAADFEELGVGVWDNDTISVSREDVARGLVTHKKIDKLPANAIFDVCLVSETAASGGLLGWPADGSSSACHRITTHADYTNQSKLLDEISVHALGGRTDGIRINLNVSKLLKAPQSTDDIDNNLDRFAQATGRVPYFVLIDAKSRSNRDLGAFSSHLGEVSSAFKNAAPGRGDGVVAAGMLSKITTENATALQIEHDVFGLDANHDYLLFFAYETSGSNGVFTRINPHKNKSNDSRTENDGIPVTTYESAPRIMKAKAQPTFGQTSRITVKFDVACDACTSVLVHLLVFPNKCKSPGCVADTLRLDQLTGSESNVTLSVNSTSDKAEGDCMTPLVQKRIELEMAERQHNRNDVEVEMGDEYVLSANSSYIVLLATETAGAQGVLSKTFEEPLRVRTHAPAPKFTEFRLEPRTGSTTELVLTFSLDHPSEVHYMLGASDNAEFNVTSPHNISNKGEPSGDRHGRGKNVHDYRHDVVRTRRSVTYSNGEHIELLDYLMPGTSYSLFIVSEALPADHGVYGVIHEVNEVSTFANAPILLAHAVYPTPGTTQALTVGFRMDAPGIVYFSAVAVKPWNLTHHVAKGSDRFGNRLALQDQLVVQKSLDVDKESMELESDSGWREQILEVPQIGLNYTVHLVTETKDSGGIYGTVATHAGVRAHSEAPKLVNMSVNPTDARVDALTVNITLSDRGHVHYIALPSGRGSMPPSDDFSHQSSELSVRASGSVDVNETTGDDQKTGFVIAGLTEGTSYDLYFRTETFESFGVFGAWSQHAVTARTHGLPADVLPEAVECKVTPSCEQRGRETCSRKANLCGKCLEGYEAAGDEEVPEGNESCVKRATSEAKRGPKIKISGIKRNPHLHLSETETEVEQEHDSVFHEQSMHGQQSFNQVVDQQDAMADVEKEIEESKPEGPTEPAMQEPMQEPIHEQLEQPELSEQHIELDQSVAPEQDIDVGVEALPEVIPEPEPIPDIPEATGCPLNAQPTASGLCECSPGYEVDEGGTSCVLSRFATVAEAAATAFDIPNTYHQIPGQSS